VRNWIGLSYYREQNYSQAIEQHRLCLQAILQGKIDDLRFRMLIHYNLANEYLSLGDQPQALDFYYEAARQAEEAEETSHLAGIYWGIGLASNHSQDFKTAMIYFAKSATLYAEIGEEKFAAQVKGFLGWTLIEREEYDQAEKNLKSALSTAIRLGENTILIYLYLNLSHLYLKTNRLEEAERFANEGLVVARKIDEPLALGQAFYSLGMVKLPQGKPEEAINFYSQAEAVLKPTDAWTYLEKVYIKWREALLTINQKGEAFEISQKAFECQEKLKLLKR
jgi:tetratricopeptide (TPR) repeat protein